MEEREQREGEEIKRNQRGDRRKYRRVSLARTMEG